MFFPIIINLLSFNVSEFETLLNTGLELEYDSRTSIIWTLVFFKLNSIFRFLY